MSTMVPEQTEKSSKNSASSHKPDSGGVRTTSVLVTDQGKTAIADAVVAKIAGIAAREISGVYAMGQGMARAFHNFRERIPGQGQNVTQGVAVEVGERQAAIDLDVVAEYGVSIGDLAAGIRRNVIAAVEKMCALEVTEVNIAVCDIHLPGEENDNNDSNAAPRVQ
jgi:uncharacterized alkaline shock family protein YloU